MKLQLTPDLWTFLHKQGTGYCLSKTSVDESDDTKIYISLKPVHYRPDIKRLPSAYDTYFSWKREPRQMAEGIDDALVLVEMDKELAAAYLKDLLKPAVNESRQLIIARAPGLLVNRMYS